MNEMSDHEKLAKAARKYPGDTEAPRFVMGAKVQQKIPTGMTAQCPKTKLPNEQEPLKSQTAVAKPLGFPT